MSQTQWYYAQGGRQFGPVPEQVLRQFLAERRIASLDLVWREGLATWQAASSFPELVPPSSASVPDLAPVAVLPHAQVVPPGTLGYGGYPVPYNYSGQATAAFVLAIIGIFTPCIGFVLGIIAIVMSSTALSGMNRTAERKGHGLAIAALVIGIIDLVGWGALLPIGLLGFR